MTKTELDIILKNSELDFLKRMIFSRNDDNLNILLDELLAVAKIIYSEELSKFLEESKIRYEEEEIRRKMAEKMAKIDKHGDKKHGWLNDKTSPIWKLNKSKNTKWSTESYNKHTGTVWTFNDIKIKTT